MPHGPRCPQDFSKEGLLGRADRLLRCQRFCSPPRGDGRLVVGRIHEFVAGQYRLLDPRSSAQLVTTIWWRAPWPSPEQGTTPRR